MVSLLSLYLLAATLLFLASVVAWLRRTKLRDALADGCAASGGALLVLAASVALFAVSQSFAASELWRKVGSLTLLVSPLGATLALRLRGRRSLLRGFPLFRRGVLPELERRLALLFREILPALWITFVRLAQEARSRQTDAHRQHRDPSDVHSLFLSCLTPDARTA